MNPYAPENLIALLKEAARRFGDQHRNGERIEIEIAALRAALTHSNLASGSAWGIVCAIKTALLCAGMKEAEIETIITEARTCEGVCCGQN